MHDQPPFSVDQRVVMLQRLISQAGIPLKQQGAGTLAYWLTHGMSDAEILKLFGVHGRDGARA